jgi:hypothetical protein
MPNVTDADTRATASAYAAFLREAAAERDFACFKPWRLGQEENDFAWQHRIVHAGATQFGKDPQDVVGDLSKAIADRSRHNDARYMARIPALLAFAYVLGVKRNVSKAIVLPLLQRRYVGRAPEPPGVNTSAVPPPMRFRSIRAHPPRPKASIVILSFNRLPYLRTTLASLRQTTARDDYELIVVDHGSRDGSAEALRAHAGEGLIDKLILCADNRGTSAGYNLGFASANPSTRYLIKLDSDIQILTPGWLSRFEAFFEAVPDAGLLALKLINLLPHRLAPTQRVAGERVISWNFWIAGGGAMTIRRSLFERLGYFREERGLTYMPDDVDYAARVALLRLRSFYLCSTRAWHREDLDRHYAAMEAQKRTELPASRDRMRTIRREYVTGARDLHVECPANAKCIFSGDQRILEIGADPDLSRPGEQPTDCRRDAGGM